MKRLAQLGMAVMIALPLGIGGPAWTRAQSASMTTVAQDAATATPVSTEAPTETPVELTATATPISAAPTSADAATPTAAVTRSLLDAPVCSPSPGAGPSLRFAVIGDYGLAGTQESDVAALVAGWSPDLVLTAGDNNYPSGAAETIDDNIGQYYHDFICPYTGAYGAGSSTNRFLPSLGNHDWGIPNAQPYLDYFELPWNERYYDHVQGPVHFFIVDSDPHEPDGIDELSTQAAWLQSGLAASSSPWQIVLMHHAPYSSSSTHGSTTTMQWPFKEWGADAVIAGHDHTYERLNIDGIPYFVNGLGGRPSTYPFGPPIPGSVRRYTADHGAMLVDATSTSIDFRFITSGGTTIDRFEMTNTMAPLVPANFYFETFITGLTQPVLATHAGDGSGRLFVVEQPGRVRVVKNGALLGTPFLNISSEIVTVGEQGLLALAFHPSYASNGFFYVAYTAPKAGNAGSILTLTRFSVSAEDEDVADPNSGLVLLTIDHPDHTNHNGGTLAFGSDGYLYWSVGDGAVSTNAQLLSTLLGKILRLDVDAAAPYIPAGNPFVESPVDDPATLAEIWAYGLRNPWRMAFDRLTGDLYIGDVGQSNWEEIDFQAAASADGANYGWRILEGKHCYGVPEGTCVEPTAYVPPVAEYSHSFGCSVTGGHVYRASNFPSLQGYYFFGDYCSGRIWALHYDADIPQWVMEQVADTTYNISSFGEDESGQVYFTDRGQGRVLKLGYQDPLAFEGVQVSPADGSSVCTTPSLATDLRLSDATRTGAGGFDISKVKLRLDGTDVTAASRVRVTQSHPASQATLQYTPPSALTLGAHLATLTYETADGPVTAAWDFTVTSGPCNTSVQQLSAAITETAAPQLQATAPTDAPAPDGADPTARSVIDASPTAPAPTSSAAAIPAQAVLPAPTGLRGCLPWNLSCPRTIDLKR